MYFADPSYLERLVAAYFENIKGVFHFEDIPVKNNADELTEKKKVWDRQPEPPTISGLAFSLGFDSVDALADYAANGLYGSMIKRASLRIEAAYEQKLHQGPASGSIFALKRLGWNQPKTEAGANNNDGNVNIIVEDHGIPVATAESEVDL